MVPRALLSFVILVGGLMVSGLLASQSLAMPDHGQHGSMSPATHDVAETGPSHAHPTPDSTHHRGAEEGPGGCAMGLMADCCVMTCCAATAPDVIGEAARHFVIVARSSRPAAALSQAIIPLLEPPKPLS